MPAAAAWRIPQSLGTRSDLLQKEGRLVGPVVDQGHCCKLLSEMQAGLVTGPKGTTVGRPSGLGTVLESRVSWVPWLWIEIRVSFGVVEMEIENRLALKVQNGFTRQASLRLCIFEKRVYVFNGATRLCPKSRNLETPNFTENILYYSRKIISDCQNSHLGT